jgi:hypothetical protein
MKNHGCSPIIVAVAVVSCFACVGSSMAGTISTTVTVNGTEMPWNWVNGGLNTGDQFGINDGTAPVVISATNGFAFTSGNVLTLTYLSGLASVGSVFPNTDAKGDTALAVNNGTGSTGKVFPSFYMDHGTYPINLGELVGTFADSSGAIVGTPFVVGDGPTALTIPAGATDLQLGVNDDRFGDNTGSWNIQISGPGSMRATVPEPGAAALGGIGLVSLASLLFRRRRQ